jgi:hypothetical protein
MFEIAATFNFRSLRKGVFERSLFVNKYLVYASILSILATIIIIYTPANKIFGTTPLSFNDWLAASVIAFIMIAFFDIFKKINLRKKSFPLIKNLCIKNYYHKIINPISNWKSDLLFSCYSSFPIFTRIKFSGNQVSLPIDGNNYKEN